MRKKFMDSMKNVNKLYFEKYGYSFDYPYIIHHVKQISKTPPGILKIAKDMLSDLAFWYFFVEGYTQKPTIKEELNNMDHLRGYYCYCRYKSLSARYFPIIINLMNKSPQTSKIFRNYIANGGKITKKSLNKKIKKICKEPFEYIKAHIIKPIIYSMAKMDNTNDIHEDIYDFLQ